MLGNIYMSSLSDKQINQPFLSEIFNKIKN